MKGKHKGEEEGNGMEKRRMKRGQKCRKKWRKEGIPKIPKSTTKEQLNREG